MAGDRVSTRTAAEARVEAYLADLAGRLGGPRRRRAQIIAELRDGLDAAVAHHVETGLPRDRAVAVAIAEFGAPPVVAQAFAGELATAYARRAVTWYIATGPLVGVWWLLLLKPHPWRTGVIALVSAIPVLPLIVVVIATAAGTIATTGRLIRWLPEASPRRALSAVTMVAALVLVSDLTVIAIYLRSGVPVRPPAIPAAAGSLARIACGLVVLRHAAAMRHALGTPGHPGETRSGAGHVRH